MVVYHGQFLELHIRAQGAMPIFLNGGLAFYLTYISYFKTTCLLMDIRVVFITLPFTCFLNIQVLTIILE